MKRLTTVLVIAVAVLLILTTAILATTAWGSILRVGHMGSDALIAHMAASGVFVTLVPIAAIIIPRWVAKSRTSAADTDRGSTRIAGLLFWLWLAASWVTMATMLSSMVQNLGTTGLLTMLSIHRWSGAVTVVTLVLLIVVGIATRRWREVPAE